MRIRSLVPKFWESKDIERLSWDTRLVFIGLWSYADDNGVGRDDPRLIAADLFPLADDPLECRARVSRGLQELCKGCQIIRYTVNEEPFYFVTEWDKYQRVDRPAKERYKRPTCNDAGFTIEFATESRDIRESVATGEGEKGRRGEGSLRPETAAPEETRQDVEQVCSLLVRRMVDNGVKDPTITKDWRREARLLIDKDGYSLQQVVQVLEWSQSDNFWKSNILSVPKLREKFSALLIKSQKASAVNGQQRGYGLPGERRSLV